MRSVMVAVVAFVLGWAASCEVHDRLDTRPMQHVAADGCEGWE